MNKAILSTLTGICLFCTLNVSAQDNDERKVEMGMELTTELQSMHKGDCNFVNLLRLNASLPISHSVTFEVASITTGVTTTESIAGDMQAFSNIEAGNVLFALSKCGVDWQIDNNHALFAGIRNMNEDYFASPVTSFFTNSSCGIYPTISANYPIANYPVASVGLHYRYEKSLSATTTRMEGTNEDEDQRLTLQASLYNGTGNNRFNGRNNMFRVCPNSNGIFGITEVAYTNKGSFYSFGNSLHCKDGLHYTPWIYAEQRLSNRFTLLAGCSHAFTTAPECSDFIGVGGHYQLGKCEIGVFTDYARYDEGDEYATEITCKIPLTSYLHIQPTAHLITTDSSFQGIAMLRMVLSL